MLGFSPLDIFTFLANPLEQLLKWLTTGMNDVAPLQAIGAFGLAVILTTIVIRAVLFPIFNWQLRTSRRIQAEQRRVAPQISALRKKYKGEPQKLSAEMNKVYKEHGISPFSTLSGCIPALVQLPVLIGLYNAIRNATNSLPHGISKHFLWIDDVSQSAAPNGNWNHVLTHPAYLILPLLAAVFTFAQSRMMMQPQRADMSDQERSAAAITKQMTLIFPVMIAIFGLLFPQGLAIYWVTGTMVMVLQQWYVVGWGGLRVPAWWPGSNRVTPLSFPPGDATPKASPALLPPKRRPDTTGRRATSQNGSEPGAADDDGAVGEERPAAAATASGGQRPRTQSQRSAAARARANRRRRRQH
ncbi:MAG: membrane protein insertase YidC [Candidatus Dormibacteraeota bacterium]|nr:membrane protein insertase YidC [Candidatus Dormibacteraeota bacterium]